MESLTPDCLKMLPRSPQARHFAPDSSRGSAQRPAAAVAATPGKCYGFRWVCWTIKKKKKKRRDVWRFEVIVLNWRAGQQVWKWTFSGGKMLRGWIWLASLFFHILLWLAGFNGNCKSTTKLLSLIISQTVDSGEENVDECRSVKLSFHRFIHQCHWSSSLWLFTWIQHNATNVNFIDMHFT